MPVATPTQSPSNTLKQLSDGNDQGTSLGLPGVTTQGAPDKIGFFGFVAPQPSGNAQAAIVRGQAAGIIQSITTLQSPTTIGGNSTNEYIMAPMANTVTDPINTGDLLYANKPSSQAGLGVGNVRVNGVNSVGVTFSNLTGTTITPTAAERYSIIALRGLNPVTAALTPAAVLPNSTAEQLFTVTGIRVGELVQVNKPTNQLGLDIVGMRVVANNQIGITFMNATSATITPTAAENYTIFSMGGLDAVNNDLMMLIGASPTTIPVGPTVTEYLMPVTGLSLGDTVRGISKPTVQNAFGIIGMRVSVPSTIGVEFINANSAVAQPTAGEVYGIALHRAAPVAPMFLYTPTLSPASVPANSSAEQTFTVNGLIASTPVWVNKPSAQPGLGIVGVRVSALNTLAINFCNTTNVSITPTAAEIYTVGNFQDPFQTGGNNTGNSVVKSAVPVIQQNAIMLNNLRAGFVANGLIAGA